MADLTNLDPELAAAVTMIPVVDFGDIAAAREQFTEVTSSLSGRVDQTGVDLRILTAPGLDDDPDVTIRLATPATAPAEPLPVVLWIHGGGFAIGTAESTDSFSFEIVRELGVAVASVEYRLAPETPFPGPLHDCYAALSYVHNNAAELGIDRTRIAVGGQSAGGGLAAGTVLLARDRGEIPVVFQLLDIPELDDRLQTTSITTFTDTPLWNRPNAVLSWQYYLGPDYAGPTQESVSIYAAPARATDLTGLPPAYVSTMELDPLRDEGITYALNLLRAGVSVELHSFPGTFHGSAFLASAEVSQRQTAELLRVLGKALRVNSPLS
ncbi:MAG: alpha/beta hydrolase [Gordonia sp. (in: high G+C Gram-positive bacteria)]